MMLKRNSANRGATARNRLNRRTFLLILAAFLAVGILAWYSVRTSALSTVINKHEILLNSASDAFEDALASVAADLQPLMEQRDMRSYALATANSNRADRTDIWPLLLGVLERRPHNYLALRYIAEDGMMRAEVVNTQAGPQPTNVQIERAFNEDPSFVNAMNAATDAPYLSSFMPQTDNSGNPVDPPVTMLRMSVPVRYIYTGPIMGVLQLDFRAEDIRTDLGEWATDDSRFLLVNNDGTVLLDTTREMSDVMQPDTAPDPGLIGLQANDGPGISLQRFLDTNGGALWAVENGTDLVSAIPFDVYNAPDMPWRLVVLEDTVAALGGFGTRANNFLLLVFVVGLGVATGTTYLLRHELRPLEHAATLIDQFTGGDEAPAPTADVSAESNELVRALAQMSNRIKQMAADMEDQKRRTERSMALAARVSRETAMLSNLDDLMNRLIDLVCQDYGFYHAQIFLLDDVGLNAVLVYSRGDAGQKLLEQGHALAVGSASVIGQVTASGEPVIARDTDTSDVHRRNAFLPDTRAEMALPLHVGDRVIGALDIQSRQTNTFTDEHVRALGLIADQIAIAINSARLLMQSDQRVHEIDRLNRQLTNAVWNEAGEKFELERVYHYNLRDVSPGEPEAPLDTEHRLSVPITIRGQVIGTMDAAMPDAYTSDDRVIMQSVAERVGLAIENARLFQETQDSLSETSAMYDVNRRLNEANTLDDILLAMVESVMPDAIAGQILEFDDYSYGEAAEWLRVSADWSRETRDADDTGLLNLRLHIPEYTFLQTLSEDQVVLVTDMARDSRVDDALRLTLRGLNAGALVAVPLLVRGTWRGMIFIEFPQPRRFTDQEGRIYTALIDQAGVAVDNRLLLKQTEMTLTQIERLYGASRIINTAQSVEDLVRAVLNTTADADRLDFGMSLLEGELDANGWPTRARMVARSVKGIISTVDEVYQLHVSPDSPMRHREPEILIDGDVANQDVPPAVVHMRSLSERYNAIFPLFSANQPIALFYVICAQAYTMSDDDYEVYVALTGQMSTVLENRRLLERTEQALDETRRLYDASRAITTAPDTDTVFTLAADHMGASSDSIERIVFLLASPDPTPDAPYLDYGHVWQRGGEDTPPLRPRLARADAPYADILQAAGQAVYLGDVSSLHDVPAVRDLLQAEGAQSAIIAPVQTRQRWFGVLVCQGGVPWAFDDQYTRFVQAVADQIAIAVENQRLFDEAQLEAQRALALAEVGQLATRIGEDFTRNIDEVFAIVARAAGYDRWLLALHDETTDELHYMIRHMPRTSDDDLGTHIDLETQRHSLIDAYLMGELITVNVPDAYPAFVDMDSNAWSAVGKHVTAPVRVGEQVLGALLVGRSLEDSDLGGPDEQLVSTLAAQVAVAVENRRLFRTAEEERQTLSSILETMPSGILVLDAETLLPIQHNVQVEMLLGRPVDYKTAFSAALYNLYRSGTNMHYQDGELPVFVSLEIGSQASIEDIVVMREDGMEIDLLMNAAPIRNADGSVDSIVTVLEDITSLRGLENALQDNLRETIALYEATRALSEADEVDDVLDTVLVQLTVNEPDDAAIVTYDEVTATYKVARALLSDPADLDIPLDLLDPGRNLFISDIAYQDDLSEQTNTELAAQGVAAIASVPLRMRLREHPAGWIITTYNQPHSFSPEEERFLTTLADNAAVALDNRFLFLSTQDALQEASILYQASRALTNVTTHDEIVQVMVDHLVYPGANQVFMALLETPDWQAENAAAIVAAGWTQGDDVVDLHGVTLTAADFPAWSLMASRDVLTVSDTNEAPYLSEMEQMGLAGLGIRSVVILPLRVSSRIIGVLWMGSAAVYNYTERDRRVYQSFAEQASITLEASRLMDQTEYRARQLATSAEVSQVASSVLDLETLLPRVVELIRDSFGYDHVQIFLMDHEDNYAELQASTGEAGAQLLAIGHKLQKGSASVVGRVTAEAQPIIALDTGSTDVVHRPNPYLPNTRSELALPLIIKGRLVGALDVQSNRPNAFDADDITVLTTLAAQISVAIDNARLFTQSESRASDMALLFAVTTAAASAESLSDALRNVAEDLRDSLNALSVGIYLPVTYIDEVTGDTRRYMQADAVAGVTYPEAEIVSVTVGDETNAIGSSAASLRPKIINKVEDEPTYQPLVADARAAVVVPLTSGSQLIGLITMESVQAYAYSHETLTLLQTMGGTLSAIIQNTQLLEQVQQQNDQLREMDRVKSEFLANMSHELRTPLNSIIGFSRVILKGIDGPLTEMQEQDLSTIYNSGQHLLGLINDLLDQAKIASGKMELKPDYFDVKPVVEGVRSIGIGLVKDKPINMTIDMQSGLPLAYGDEFRTRQVLLNLVSNASKFTSEGSITLAVYTTQHPDDGRQMIRIDVRDTGIGVAEKDMPLLFEAFRQVDSSLTRTAGGTGLGLPISKSLVELQGGQMLVESTVNVGSTFSITIPLDPPPGSTHVDDAPDAADTDAEVRRTREVPAVTAPATNGDHPAAPPRQTETYETVTLPPMMMVKRQVLLIEENPDRVDQYRRAIQREGFDVFAASIPLEAEAMASGLRPSVIVMDVDFANGAGWDILGKLKQRDDTFDIPVIVATLSEERERALDMGVFAFLQHPILPEDLKAAVLEAEQENNTDRILIIDDQPDSTRLLTQLLDQHGKFRVFAAHNGLEGVSLVARRRPDLVILDLRMPEMDGFKVIDELRSNPETADIPILVVTSDDSFDETERGRLTNVNVINKADISEDDFQHFIKGVRTHLSRNGE